ncbi:MAG: polymer-forming cytoskeletal protein [Syntrophomonas sp.]|uniref:bactofilin family protein n=1 Tax=Syntrophomonas sp. TaxID=2053627 RepID=UPI002601E6CB|nr:polymer-forming cytoskeletal protein [Syntrophomonas sp.]MDD2510581.1 polymer-forming cytoskeletal protein [Syntrophomonas sp.]MDD3880467.1 polymer-forming cytoskeletal protein [Syntrophomonas sp.]MDD4626298.1 polymer-forming cytoskeletal protein [Syntrophomonas sp.]
MWKKDKQRNIESLISHGVLVKGEIRSSGSIRIDGNVEGRVDVKGDLIVGEKGKIKGEILADNLILAGKIEGNIEARGRLEITATGSITGDASCSLISIEEGGFIDGTSKMIRPREKVELKKGETMAVAKSV